MLTRTRALEVAGQVARGTTLGVIIAGVPLAVELYAQNYLVAALWGQLAISAPIGAVVCGSVLPCCSSLLQLVLLTSLAGLAWGVAYPPTLSWAPLVVSVTTISWTGFVVTHFGPSTTRGRMVVAFLVHWLLAAVVTVVTAFPEFLRLTSLSEGSYIWPLMKNWPVTGLLGFAALVSPSRRPRAR